VTAFTFERLIVVLYPLKRTQICTVKRAKVIIACLTLAAAVIQVVTLFPTGVVETKKASTALTNQTIYSNGTAETIRKSRRLPFYYEMMRILNMLETAVTMVIPPVLIVIMNGFIIRGLFKFNQTFKTGANNQLGSVRTSTTIRTTHLQPLNEDDIPVSYPILF
jgi:hypothetical protein